MRQTVAIPSQRLSEPLGDHLVDGSRDRRFVVLTTLARYLHAWGYTHHAMASFGRIVGIQSTLLALCYMVAASAYYILIS